MGFLKQSVPGLRQSPPPVLQTMAAELSAIAGATVGANASSVAASAAAAAEGAGTLVPPLISYIVLAEFDINMGSTVRNQYPTPVPWVSADWLAEHMIPEGAHLREMVRGICDDVLYVATLDTH